MVAPTTMAGVGRICLQSFLKLVNSIIGMAGIAMIVYALWMLRAWFRQTVDSGVAGVPWFIYAFLGLGIFLCVITCSGHVAAETANGHCLSCYMLLVFVLLVVEAGVTADIFLNEHWEEDFPHDRTGKFNELEEFVKSNFDICKWIALTVVGAQGLSILLSIVLKAVGPERESCEDSDDENAPARLPLLGNQVQNPPYIPNSLVVSKNDSWNVRIDDKMNK